MRNGLDGFSGASPQRMNLDDVAPTDVSQYRPEGGELRRYGDIDVLAFDEVNIGGDC